MTKTAIYPGSFDPLTNGHLDIIQRGATIFGRVIVTILQNPSKKYLFSVEERIELIRKSIPASYSNIEVASYDGLLVDYAKIRGADAVIRGMRAVSDFENEFQMALMNRRLNRDVQTVFLMTGLRWIFTSSSIIKEVASFGGDITGMVPSHVGKRLIEKLSPAE